MGVFNIEGTSLKMLSFPVFGLGSLGSAFVMLSCTIFSYKRLMSAHCVQLPSAGKRVIGPSYLFVFCAICPCDRLAFCARIGTQGRTFSALFSLCLGSGLAPFLWFDGLCEGVQLGLCQSFLNYLGTALREGSLWGAVLCSIASCLYYLG